MSSKFSNIFAGRNQDAPSEPEEPATPSPAPSPTPEKKPRAIRPAIPAQLSASPKKPGRPPGKRSDGRHVQVTAYILGDTHQAVKEALVLARKGQEFSELVEELLSKWLKSRT